MGSSEELAALNLEIGKREDAGDQGFFTELLASAFAMRRASGAVVGKADYLAALKPSPPGTRVTHLGSIALHGQQRATVTCTVAMGDKRFHNLRLFIRQDARWQLLAWANEEV